MNAPIHTAWSFFREQHDVHEFQRQFEIPMAQTPSLLGPELYRFRAGFLEEEVREFREAHDAGDLLGAADALVDLAYVLHGTALMMGLPWPRLWETVQEKNMLKVRALHAADSKRGTTYDVVKPAGWTPPDHREALGEGPWPVFDPSK